MTWSAQQQSMLAAMGYTLYRQAGAPPALAVAAAPAAAATDNGVESPKRADADAGAADQALLQALRRAAGGRDLAALPLPPLSSLRAGAAAKRALWPRLRALRRS